MSATQLTIHCGLWSYILFIQKDYIGNTIKYFLRFSLSLHLQLNINHFKNVKSLIYLEAVLVDICFLPLS